MSNNSKFPNCPIHILDKDVLNPGSDVFVLIDSHPRLLSRRPLPSSYCVSHPRPWVPDLLPPLRLPPTHHPRHPPAPATVQSRMQNNNQQPATSRTSPRHTATQLHLASSSSVLSGCILASAWW